MLDQMDAAYGTICYAAFFDTLSERLPEDIVEGIALTDSEKKAFSNKATDVGAGDGTGIGELVRPDIAYGIDEAKNNLLFVYRLMSDKLRKFINGLEYVEKANEKVLSTIRTAFENLPEAAVEKFEKQYFELCMEIPQFYSYISLKTQNEYALKAEEQRNQLEKVMLDSKNEINAGLTELKHWISTLDQEQKKDAAIDAANSIIDKARKGIEKPVFGSEQKTGDLKFPSIEKAFIPQSYKALIYSGEEHLEDRNEWEKRPEEHNQAAFWAKYFNDPQSTENILLILGEPGIGKSLLTKVVAAQLGSLEQIIIRVPLRDTDVEKDIAGMILKQINNDGDAAEPFKTLKAFTGHFSEHPITVIFDGYDELQQATGRVYHEFLDNLSSFQQECMENGRPARIVVTSRATLIDKAEIPLGTVVIQLNEFDEKRKKKWIEIWNRTNAECFGKYGLEAFALPENNKDIDKLSGQPLLLLMLAIYDADTDNKKNVLNTKRKIIKTELYNELIRRFIKRELKKGQRGKDLKYEEQNNDEKKETEEKEMKRLGIAALGMFVRGKLSITVEELKEDLKLMKASLGRYSETGSKMLKDEEAFFGSFFFIHDPRPSKGKPEDFHEASFEFLHKTFYEFLVADIVLQSAFKCIKSLCKKKDEKDDDDEMTYDDRLEELVHKPNDLLLVLSSVSLCSEPVIIEMMIEWAERRFWCALGVKIKKETVKDVFHDLFEKHSALVRDGKFVIDPTLRGCIAPKRTHPQICAAYLLNLLTVAVIACSALEVDAELWKYSSRYIHLNLPEVKKQDKTQDDKKKLKIEVSYSDEMMLRFVSWVSIGGKEKVVTFNLRQQEVELEKLDLLAARMEVFDFLREEEQKNVYSLHRTDIKHKDKQAARKDLSQRGMAIEAESLIASLCDMQANGKYDYDMELLFRIADALSECEDEVFVQNALNTMLSFVEDVIISRGVDDSYRIEIMLHCFSRIINRFSYSEGIIKTVISIVGRLSRLFMPKESKYYSQYRTIEQYQDFFDRLYREAARMGSIDLLYAVSKESVRLLGAQGVSVKEGYDGKRDMDRALRYHDMTLPFSIKAEIIYGDDEDIAMFEHRYSIRALVNSDPKDIDAIIEVAKIFKYLEGDAGVNELLRRSRRSLRYILNRRAFDAEKLLGLYRVAKNTDPNLSGKILEAFDNGFPVFYYSDARSSVELFCELANSPNYAGNEGVYHIGRYILRNYTTILDQSLSMAILALKTCIRMDVDSDLVDSSIKKCFNAFIYDPNYDSADRLIGLIGMFDRLDRYRIYELADYFRKNHERIRKANVEIADRLNEFYSGEGINLQ